MIRTAKKLFIILVQGSIVMMQENTLCLPA